MNGTVKDHPGESHGQLGLWDAVSIIVGIVIGTSIFTTPPTIFSNVAGPWEGLGVWLFCGILSLIGALCYAELATTYPRSGGDYVYLTRAFDRPIGFLFGWGQLTVILAGSTGAMAFIFGEYCARFVKTTGLMDIPDSEQAEFTAKAAIAAVAGLSVLNFFGVVLGKWVQNLLVLAKLIGLGLIVAAGLIWAKADAFDTTGHTQGPAGYGLAIILVLYAYGGWNDAAFVAADMRNRRDIPKALILGTLAITVIYLLVNAAYILGLGFLDASKWHPTIAADVLKPMGDISEEFIGVSVEKIISVLVMTSALGAMNGLIFTGSRVYSSLGAEHRIFSILGRWNKTLNAPIWSLLTQALIAVGMIYLVGTEMGRQAMDDALAHLHIPAIPWGQYFGGFNTLFAGTAPVFWIFFLLTGLSVFVLRAKDPDIHRPFMLRSPFYPVLPLLFCGMCVYGLISALDYAKWVSLLGFVPMVVGVILYILSALGKSSPSTTTKKLQEV